VTKSELFEMDEEFLAHFPGRNRRWEISIFRNEPVEGGLKQILVEHFLNARSFSLSGRLSNVPGQLHFYDENGKEVLVSEMPFIARELTSKNEA